MDIDPDPDPDKEQKADLSLCIICQEKNDEDLVEKPNSHEKTLESIKEWATYGERKYVRSRDKLSFYSYLYSRLRDGNGCAARTKELLRKTKNGKQLQSKRHRDR